ncbi:MAG: glutamate-cysteine ligase family protein [Pirellulaceae bacterium]
MGRSPLHLFERFGIEMEYMLVDAQTLDVRSAADELLRHVAGQTVSDIERGPITWSNELALHVIELKTSQPAKSFLRLPSDFETAIADLQPSLDALHLKLLPTAVHPWMNPETETKLWPHECAEIYEAYHQIFNCHAHGWANVQSVHLNLPFDGDGEFGKLHAAVRILLPLLPALAASSPVLEGAYTGLHDTRMQLYAKHCHVVPFLSGALIPEPIFDEETYRREIFGRISHDIAPHNTHDVLQVEFLNARGAIARFDRGSIELRVMDVQEYPAADVAICAGVSAVLRVLCEGHWSDLESQKRMPSDALCQILDSTIQRGEHARITNPEFLAHFGISKSAITAKQLWNEMLSTLKRSDPMLDGLFAPLEIILSTGTLSSRIAEALGPSFTPGRLRDVYHDLADCLVRWQSFQP